MRPVSNSVPSPYAQPIVHEDHAPQRHEVAGHAASRSEPPQPPALGQARQYRAGRYAHLAEAIVSQQLEQAQPGKARQSKDKAVAETSRAGQASPAAASSSATRPGWQAADLGELARWSENACSHSFDPRGIFGRGAKVPSSALTDMVKRGKASLESALAAEGIPLKAVVVAEDSKHIDINLNHIEMRHFLRREKGMWTPMDKGRAAENLDRKATEYLQAFAARDNAHLAPLGALSGKDSRSVMKELLRGATGLVVGEAHSSVSSKRELINNFDNLKADGLTTLFFEHLCSDCHGQALDDYLKSPKGSPMPARLKAYLDMQTAGNTPLGKKSSPYNFASVVEAAKNAGLNIVPIDTAQTYATSGSGDNQRIRVMNYYAAEKIRLSAPEGKWLAFVGSAHASTYQGIPGLSQLTGVRSLIIDDFGKRSKPEVAINVKGYADEIDPDVTLSYKASS